MSPQAPGRISAIDFIRAYAIVLVVMVHASGPPLYAYKDMPRAYWWTANLFDSFARPCVPLFIMISGFLLLDAGKDEPLSVFFRKRLSKVVVPYLFWAAFYLWWRWYFHAEEFDLSKLGHELVGGTAYYHLVFMNVILGLYLLTPMLRVFVKNANVPTQLYVIGLWFLLSSVMPLVNKLSTYTVNLYLQITPLFLGHFLYGSLFKRIQPRLRRRHLYALAGVLLATVFLTAYSTYRYTKRAGGELDEYFYTYASPNVVIMSAISFVLLLSVFSRPVLERVPVLPTALRHVGATSFGIYFTHVVLLECLGRGAYGYRLTATTFHPSISIPLLTLTVVAVSAVVMFVVQRIPVVRHLVP